MEEVKVKKGNFEIAVKDIAIVEYFLRGMSAMRKIDRDEYDQINACANKLSNAVQWLHNHGKDD